MTGRTENLELKMGQVTAEKNAGGIAWNDPTIGVRWPGLEGAYRGTANAEGYFLDGTPLKLSRKDQLLPEFAHILR